MGIRQRARWFHGLYYCTFLVKNDLPIRANFILTCFVLSWWSLFSLTLLKLVFQLGCSSNGVGLIKGTLFAMAEVFSFNYVLGFLMNFSPLRRGCVAVAVPVLHAHDLAPAHELHGARRCAARHVLGFHPSSWFSHRAEREGASEGSGQRVRGGEVHDRILAG